MTKLKVWFVGTPDGINNYLIVAPNQKAAAEACGLTFSGFSSHCSTPLRSGFGDHDDLIAIAMLHPGKAWKRKMTHFRSERDPWKLRSGEPHGAPPVRVSWNVNGDRGIWEIDRVEWLDKTAAERDEHLDGLMQQEIANRVDAGYAVLPPDAEVSPEG